MEFFRNFGQDADIWNHEDVVSQVKGRPQVVRGRLWMAHFGMAHFERYAGSLIQKPNWQVVQSAKKRTRAETLSTQSGKNLDKLPPRRATASWTIFDT